MDRSGDIGLRKEALLTVIDWFDHVDHATVEYAQVLGMAENES